MTVAEQSTQRSSVPADRLRSLCDPGSVTWLSGVPGARLVAVLGRVDGLPVACYANDGSVGGGALGEVEADAIVATLRAAAALDAPVVSFVESAGARVQEGVAALAGYGRVFRESVALPGTSPQISVITGTAAGGSSYSPALTDLVVMTRGARMFLTGPAVVRRAIGERIAPDDLGGPKVHAHNGVAHLTAEDDSDAIRLVRALIGLLAGPRPAAAASASGSAADPGRLVPREGRRAYDVRSVARCLVDGANLLELQPRWGRNVVTALARVAGWPTGVLANQPHHLGGLLDARGADKAAAFVRLCDRFRLPMLVLVDTPGFMPGTRQEHAGVIRQGAALVRAFASATVPRVTLVLRKAYGGAYIAMNSKELGADRCLAWPQAEIGIMSARQAMQVVAGGSRNGHRDAVSESLVQHYAERHVGTASAVAGGWIDEVIAPAESAARVRAALADARTGTRGHTH